MPTGSVRAPAIITTIESLVRAPAIITTIESLVRAPAIITTIQSLVRAPAIRAGRYWIITGDTILTCIIAIK